MVITNYSMPDSSKMTPSSNTSSRNPPIKPEKKKENPKTQKKEKDKKDSNIITEKELREKEYQKEMREKKLKEALEEKKYRDISVRISPEENFFCLAVDGSQTSKDAFEILIKEFLNHVHNSVLICPHIYNNTQDDKFNWRYQKAQVLEYYKTRLTTSIADHQGYLIIQDRDTYKMHEIEQAYKISEKNESKYFFCGYDGLREQSLKPSRIDVGLEYLLSESKVPVFIMKDKYKRGEKNKGYKWLLIMDRSNEDCLKVLDLFLPLIDREVDRIYGLTLLPPFVSFDDIKAPFYEKMKELNFSEGEQFDYELKEYKGNPLTILTEFVNHNTDHYFDFVIFLNNPQKFKIQKKDSYSFKYIKLLSSNIAFCNYAYLDGYDYKVISKLPSEIDDRKYLANFYKMDIEEIKASLGMKKDNENGNKINEIKGGEIHSEIYGVNKGQVYEKSSSVTPVKKTVEAPKQTENKKGKVVKPKDTGKKNIKGNNVTNKYNKGKTAKK